MKNIFLKVLKVSLIVTAAILIILLIFGIVLRLNWPWWVGFFLLVILIGLGLGGLFLRKLLLRRRERRFVQHVIEQDETRLKTVTGEEKNSLKELQNRWKEAIDALRHSHLRKYGNPLYVLPWYLVIGESGSGKTTAINSARLSSPFVEVNRASGISGTKNCDWWFFEQAIVIDTAGRFAIPIDEGRDKDEWQNFLSLLSKYRKKEPINGLIVTVSADKLLEAHAEKIEEDGRNIRKRIDELMRVLGAKFPIYVLVTKCDLIQGMTKFSDQLPEKSLDQPMGVVNQDLSTNVAAFLDNTIGHIGDRLRYLRLLLLHKRESKVVDPVLLLFPEEFENLKQGLVSFVRGAFQENPFQETPILRGIFFSSGRQEGSPYSHFLNKLGLIGEKEVLLGTNKGLFLHDFFSQILPKDRRLFAPTRRAIEWRLLTRNLGLSSWILLCVALCGMLSFSFVKNLQTIREVSHEFAKPPVLVGDIQTDLDTMDRFRHTILDVENQNRSWWIPRFGLKESIKVEKGLKDKYCKQFREGFLLSFDKQLKDNMTRLTASTDDEIIGQYIVHLERRINLLKARLEGQDFESLQTRPQPPYVTLLSPYSQGSGPEIKKKFSSLFLYYLAWRSNSADISKEIDILQSWLKDLLKLKGTNLQWLVVWVDKYGSLSPVTLGDFWGGSSIVQEEKLIMPSFTIKGKELIDSLIKDLEFALSNELTLTDARKTFEKRYRNAYFDAWYNFAAAFPTGSEKLKGMKERQQIAAKISTDQGPYFAFINKMASDLEPLVGEERLPLWLQQLYQFQMVKLQAAQGGLLGKAAEQGKGFIAKIEKIISREAGKTSELEILAVKAYQEYQSALEAITPAAASRNQAYQIALQVFSEDPTASKSPLFAAYSSVTKLKNSVVKKPPVEEVLWRLVTGPLDYLWALIQKETACYIQKQWEEKVLAETQGSTNQQTMQLLLSQDGPVRKFYKEQEHFIGWSLQKGYYSKESLGGVIPFDSSFFTFLSKGVRSQATALARQKYKVTIKGLPTNTNSEAQLKPHVTKLELQCAEGTQTLINYQYPINKTFNWSSETCGDVLFQIGVGDATLTKVYTGTQAFPEFLQDFGHGSRTFYPNEFPKEKGYLDRLGIKYIKVNYQFSGDRVLLGEFSSLPGQIPRNIARCWD